MNPQDKIDCPWCGGFGWVDADEQPAPPGGAVGPCGLCNGDGALCPADLLELRVLARDAALILGGDCSRTGVPGSRWPNHEKLSSLAGPDLHRSAPTAVELDRWLAVAR